ncbi:hypothetical protein Phum_PHUM298460 [Pediculus humanus corporis]|uniref:Uncharacterized protein n=1 Tax=Pediculus humanus subsp. corporis TaxID=121224 RepID=E0VM03_PEDHC|nr:uncharacterized protein Phum_PHUM298460 [Pediculus humanus corporis]EEB14409.1 hypothetical protein Phum_PHUM298460 [Pediculus humanus corporis]
METSKKRKLSDIGSNIVGHQKYSTNVEGIIGQQEENDLSNRSYCQNGCYEDESKINIKEVFQEISSKTITKSDDLNKNYGGEEEKEDNIILNDDVKKSNVININENYKEKDEIQCLNTNDIKEIMWFSTDYIEVS